MRIRRTFGLALASFLFVGACGRSGILAFEQDDPRIPVPQGTFGPNAPPLETGP